MNKNVLIALKIVKYLLTSVFITLFVLLFPVFVDAWSFVLFPSDLDSSYIGRFLFNSSVAVAFLSVCGFIYGQIHYKDKFGYIIISISLSVLFYILVVNTFLDVSLDIISCNEDAVDIISEKFMWLPRSFFGTFFIIFSISAFFTQQSLNKKPK